MKILFVLENYAPHVGGVETEFEEFARHLSNLGHSVRVVTSNSGGLTGSRTDGGVEIFHYPWFSMFGHPLGRVKDIRNHAEWADIVHTATYSAAIPALRAARQFNKPCLLTAHEVVGSKWKILLGNPLLALLLKTSEQYIVTRSFDAWIVTAEAVRRDALAAGIPAERIHLIQPGINTTLWDKDVSPLKLSALLGVPESSRVFLFFGRPGKTKGTDILLKAIHQVADDLPPDVKFGFILGNHPAGARDEFTRNVTQCGLNQWVRVVPSVERTDLPGYVKDAFCVIVPSRTEGFGFVAAETCQMNVPIISSDAGSLPEVVSGKHLFFESENHADLAEKLLLACRQEFSYKPCHSFTWERSSQNLSMLYDDILASSAKVKSSGDHKLIKHPPIQNNT